MDNFKYWAPTQYIFGRETERETGSMVRSALNCTKVLVVTGHSSARKSGLLDRVFQSLTVAGISWIELTGIDPNPTDDRVYEGINLCREHGIEGLLAVGGGSAIDTAKAIAAGVPYEGDFWDFFCGKAVVNNALPVGVVLTIPAAGSEGSGNSVITKLDGMHKISIRTDYWLRPKFAILNPELTFTLPKFQLASGIADMMAHIMERYFTPTDDVETTDRIAEGILKAIINEAPKAIDNPTDYPSHANIMWAGTLAHNGICGCGRVEDWVSHAMEHELSALYGVTHGAGLAVVFPAWLTFMTNHKPAKIAQFARRLFDICEADERSAALKGIAALKAFYTSIGLPITLSQLGIDAPDIDRLVEKLHENKGKTIGGYLRLTCAETEVIYKLMLND